MKIVAWQDISQELRDKFIGLWADAQINTGCLKYAVGTRLEIENFGRLYVTRGYNRSPKGTKDSKEIGICYRIEKFGDDSNQYRETGCRALHSEQEAMLNMYKMGVKNGSGKMFVTAHPCNMCSKLIASSDLVTELTYLYPKMDELSLEILENAGIKVTMLHRVPFSIESKDY